MQRRASYNKPVNLKPFAFMALMAVATCAKADWEVVTLHPAVATRSVASAGAAAAQGGYCVIDGRTRAYMWQGTAASAVDLRPGTIKNSEVLGLSATQQVGYTAEALNTRRAAIWTGSAASWVDIHPSVALASQAEGTDGVSQVGSTQYYTTTFINRAALWKGSAESFVDLGPPNAQFATALAVLGDTQVGRAGNSPCLWRGTAESFVSLQPPGYGTGAASCLTATHQGGVVQLAEKNHAMIWKGTAESYVDLHPPEATHSVVHDMVGNIQVGAIVVNFVYRPCYWMGTASSLVDLSPSMNAAGYTGGSANGVGTDGTYIYISGNAADAANQDRAILWRLPIEEGFALRLNKSVVAGQNSVQGTVAHYVEQQSAATYAISDDSSLVTTPASITVAANTLSKNFQITVTAVNSPINTTIFAKRGPHTRSAPLTLTPLVPTALAFTPNPVPGGQTVSARVVINGVAGPGGRTIAIFDNSPYSTTPSTVTVPAGATEVIFPISTRAVPAQQTVIVTARVTAGEKTGAFRITP